MLQRIGARLRLALGGLRARAQQGISTIRRDSRLGNDHEQPHGRVGEESTSFSDIFRPARGRLTHFPARSGSAFWSAGACFRFRAAYKAVAPSLAPKGRRRRRRKSSPGESGRMVPHLRCFRPRGHVGSFPTLEQLSRAWHTASSFPRSPWECRPGRSAASPDDAERRRRHPHGDRGNESIRHPGERAITSRKRVQCER
jgi:hypothetical protein